MNIVIISSADEKNCREYTKQVKDLILELKKSFSELKIITGGSLGIPGISTRYAQKIGIKTKCYSPDKDLYTHELRHDNLKTKYFSEVVYVPGFTNRSLHMINDADGIILLNGRIGTLSEFTIALEEGKKVSVLTETGGIADHLEYILDITQKEFPGQVFFSDSIIEVVNFLKQKPIN